MSRLLALCLLWPALALAGPAEPVTLTLTDVKLAEALALVARAGGLDIAVDPTLALDLRVTMDLKEQPARQAIDRLLRLAPGATIDEIGDVLVIHGPPQSPTVPAAARPTVMTPPVAPVRPVQPAPTAAPTAPVQGTTRYLVIPLQYAYAPGVAQILGGRSLLYSDIDPWARALGPFGTLGPVNTRRTYGPGTAFNRPAGVDGLVGVDWGVDGR